MYIKICCLMVVFAVSLVFAGVVEALPAGHVVKPNETLSHLSQRYLKHVKYWRELHSRNADIKNPHLIYPGQYIKFTSPKGVYLSLGFGYAYNLASGQLSSILIYQRPGLPYPPTTLIAHNNNSTNGPDIHIEAGYRWHLYGPWSWSVGGRLRQIELEQSGDECYKGGVVHNSYNYNISDTQLSIVSRLNYRRKNWQYYAEINFGSAFIVNNDYANNNLGTTALGARQFSLGSSTSIGQISQAQQLVSGAINITHWFGS